MHIPPEALQRPFYREQPNEHTGRIIDQRQGGDRRTAGIDTVSAAVTAALGSEVVALAAKPDHDTAILLRMLLLEIRGLKAKLAAIFA